jgi:chemotaxis family two-component system sensor kinase Cph1
VHMLDPRLRPYLGAYFLIAALVIGVAAAIVHLLAEDLRQSLRQARLSEERYRLISEVSTDYVFSSAVGRDGQVRQNWVAGAFERMTGYSFEEFMAHGGWRAALHPDDVAQDDRDLETLRGNRPVITELRTLTRGGEQRWVRVYGHPVWDPAENRLAGIYGAVQDITEAKRAEAEREALIRELEAKNAELERFTYTVSHDLKSPLVTIRGFLGFVERDAVAGNHERLQIDLRRIDEATDRMATLLDELLELSRVGRVVNPPEAIPFGELAADAAALVAGPIAERGVQVQIDEGLPTVWGDRTRLLQVVQNLLENAVKFSGDQPRPRVEIGARAGSPPLLYVRDNGVGVEASHHERIFGLFDKLDAKSPGAGVGLALVRRIVELHGGRVWVESDGAGGGSTFLLSLPAPPVSPGPS